MLKRLFYLACLLVALFALYAIVAGNPDIERATVNVDGIPVEVFTRIPAPNERIGRRPAVVIAHGFAGSKQVMYAIALELARDHHAVFVFDFSGHGANATLLPTAERNARLTADLDRVIQYARQRPDVNSDLIALVGHSMGAGVVVPYAKAHPEIKAVVSISGIVTDVTPTAPRNLLLMAGALEFESIRKAQEIAFTNGGGKQADDPGSGRKREVVIVPNAEHITILWSEEALQRIGFWVFQSLGYGSHVRYGWSSPLIPLGDPHLDKLRTALEETWLQKLWRWIRAIPVLDAALIAVASFFLFFPLATFAATRFRLRATVPAAHGLPYWKVLVSAGVPAVLTPLTLRALYGTPLDPAQVLPIQIVNYLAFHFLLYGALMALCLRWLGGRGAFAAVRWSWLAIAGSGLFFEWLFVTNGVVAHLTWMNFIPTGTRLWLVPVVCVLIGPYFVVNEVVTKSASLRRGALNELTGKALLIGSLLFAVAITPGLFFLLLVVAVFALFFMAYGVYALHLHRLTGNPLVAALGYAAMTAALLVAVFPISG